LHGNRRLRLVLARRVIPSARFAAPRSGCSCARSLRFA